MWRNIVALCNGKMSQNSTSAMVERGFAGFVCANLLILFENGNSFSYICTILEVPVLRERYKVCICAKKLRTNKKL